MRSLHHSIGLIPLWPALSLVASCGEAHRHGALKAPSDETALLSLTVVLLASVILAAVVQWARQGWSSGQPRRRWRDLARALKGEVRFLLTLFLVTGVGSGVTVAAVLTTQASEHREAFALFEKARDRAATEVERRVLRARFPLHDAQRAHAVASLLERSSLQRYVETRELSEDFPGMLGIGLIKPFTTRSLDAFLASERADGAPTFELHHGGQGAASLVLPRDPDERRYVITSCYPEGINRPVWGLEVGADPVRRAAIDRAIDTGEPAISGSVELPQVPGDSTGLLLFVPLYGRDVDGASPEERREALVGLVYAPIQLRRALESVTMLLRDGLDFEIFDGELPGPAVRIYDADGHLGTQKHAFDAAHYEGRHFLDRTSLSIAGRQWTLVTSTLPAFDAGNRSSTPWLAGVGGALLTALATAFAWLALSGRARALRLAHRITEDLRVAQASADRLASIARLTSNAVIITDTQGRIEWVNEGFTRITGYPAAEVLGRRPGDFLQGPESDREAVARMREAQARGEPCSVEVMNYRRDGTPYRLHIELVPMRSSDGTLTGFMAIETDVTVQWEATTALRHAKAAAEAALRESSVFRATLDEHSIISIADDHGRILEVNSRFCEISGYSKDELVGQDHRILNSGEHTKDFWAALWGTLSRGGAWRGELCNRRKDGSHYWVDSIIAGFVDADGKVERYVSIRSDITARKEAEARSPSLSGPWRGPRGSSRSAPSRSRLGHPSAAGLPRYAAASSWQKTGPTISASSLSICERRARQWTWPTTAPSRSTWSCAPTRTGLPTTCWLPTCRCQSSTAMSSRVRSETRVYPSPSWRSRPTPWSKTGSVASTPGATTTPRSRSTRPCYSVPARHG